MPGGGKSTVGRQLARRRGYRFADSDDVIERQLGMTIREYFVREGEDAFRDIEEAVIREQTHRPEGVLATGGGAILRESNRHALHSSCCVIYLRSSPEELFRRLRHDTHRPLLQVKNPLGRLRELYSQRDPLYRRTAHFVIETGRPSVHTLVNMILMQLELAGLVAADQAPSSIGGNQAGNNPRSTSRPHRS